MSLMVIDRRQFIVGSSLSMASALWPLPASDAFAADQKTLLIAACRRADGGFSLLVLTPDGEIIRSIPLNGRGHDVALYRPTGDVVAFARRPGRFALAFNLQNATAPTVFTPPSDRHFYGHGTFSLDGRLLFATENDFDNARGLIGIYDASDKFARIGEFESHGLGPHDMLLLEDGKTLVVANGGIETHPESGRTKLNVTTMKPSLCFIDAATGDLMTRHTLPQDNHQLSIRHLTANQNGDVWFGGQWEGRRNAAPGLVGTAGVDKPLSLLDGAQDVSAQLRVYIGSVALSGDGRWLAASAPRAGKIVYFDINSPGTWRQTQIKDASGIAALKDTGFVVSSGDGLLCHAGAETGLEKTHAVNGIAFDNHVRVFA